MNAQSQGRNLKILGPNAKSVTGPPTTIMPFRIPMSSYAAKRPPQALGPGMTVTFVMPPY